MSRIIKCFDPVERVLSMKRSSTRRKLLATLGTATTFSLAGCSAVLGPSDSGTSNKSTSTADSSGTDTTTKNGTKNGGNKGGNEKTPQQKNTPFTRGTVIEDFEKKLKRWRPLAGKVTLDTKNPYQGSQSMVLKTGTSSKKKSKAPNSTNATNTTSTPSNSSGNAAGVARSYYSSDSKNSGLDLRKHDLTMAVRFEKPVDGRIGVELIAPSSTLSLTSRRYIPIELNGWTRIDLGYTGKEGKPTLKKVLGMRIIVNSSEGPINVAIDDIRKIPKAKKGKVMFQFDDGHITTYTKAFPKLKERQWPAGAAIIPDSIGTAENMKWSDARKLNKAGWDIMSHPPVSEPLPTLSPKKQEREIRDTKNALEYRGFKKGARHIVAPYGRVSNKTIDIMKKYHEANYIFGGTPNNAKHPSNMYAISRVQGTSPGAVKDIIDLAEKYRQMVVVMYHDIGTGSNTSVTPEEFESVLNHVEKKKMDVVSPSQFLDSTRK
jgi:peptidoglycan/xylan/chitin deacetylase (PgdA/CDA1 family)